MDKNINKKLASNWFKILQDIICKDIEEIENKKIFLIKKSGVEARIKVEENLEFLKMVKFLTKLV